jgi:adducin
MKCGLLPLCPEAMELGEISFYDFPGIVTNDDEVDKLIRSFGPSNRVPLLYHHCDIQKSCATVNRS